MPVAVVRQLLKDKADEVVAFVSQSCDRLNRAIESLRDVHTLTPGLEPKSLFRSRPFDMRRPLEPVAESYSFLGRFFRSHRERIDRSNRISHEQYVAQLESWTTAQAAHLDEEEERRRRFEAATGPDASVEPMSSLLEEHLLGIEWPRETLIDFQFAADGRSLFLDVDLPEIEDMPRQEAMPAGRYNIKFKPLSDRAVRELYMRHVHGVGFRLLGEALAYLPTLSVVAVSAYTQRIDSSTGQVTDDYLYSVRIQREQWRDIAFERLRDIDPVEALTRFDLRREMTKTGVFKAIEPFAPDVATSTVNSVHETSA